MPADDAVSPMQGDRYPTGYIRRTDAAASGHDLVAEKLLHPDAMGMLVPGTDKHFYSSGAFNLIQLIFYILKQTGPAHLFLTTYSISMDSINAQTVRLSGDYISGLLPLPGTACEGGVAV